LSAVGDGGKADQSGSDQQTAGDDEEERASNH